MFRSIYQYFSVGTLLSSLVLVSFESNAAGCPFENSQLTDVASGVHMEVRYKINCNGSVEGNVHTWSDNAIQGAHAAARVKLFDKLNRVVWSTPEIVCGVAGRSECNAVGRIFGDKNATCNRNCPINGNIGPDILSKTDYVVISTANNEAGWKTPFVWIAETHVDTPIKFMEDKARDIKGQLLEESWLKTVNELCTLADNGFSNVVRVFPSKIIDKAKTLLIENGFYKPADFHGVTIQECLNSTLDDRADAMVPVPNTIWIAKNIAEDKKKICRNDTYFLNYDCQESIKIFASLLGHEMVHINQIRRMGYDNFAKVYMHNIVKNSSFSIKDISLATDRNNNELEKEAYDFQAKIKERLNNNQTSSMTIINNSNERPPP